MTEKEVGSKKSKKGGKIAIVVCIIIIITLIGVIACILRGKQQEDGDSKRNVLVTKDNVEDVIEESAKIPTKATEYTVTMTDTVWTYEDGTSVSPNSYVENSKDNSTDVCFDIVRSDNNETIYSSPIIPLGEHLDGVKLDKDLDAGTYDCVMIYRLVDKDQKELSHVNVGLQIIVQN